MTVTVAGFAAAAAGTAKTAQAGRGRESKAYLHPVGALGTDEANHHRNPRVATFGGSPPVIA